MHVGSTHAQVNTCTPQHCAAVKIEMSISELVTEPITCQQIADVWSCGVMLYIMLAAAYPFGRPEDENLKPSRKMHVMLQVPALPSSALPLL